MRRIKRTSRLVELMAELLPGGVHPWHVYDASKAGYYSQLQLKRCMEDRNPLLPLMEDKYRSRELVASKEVCHLTELYHWSEDVDIDWDNLPERCVIKTNHWSGDALSVSYTHLTLPTICSV